MKMRKWLENWDLTKLSVKVGFLEMEWEPKEPDREAAWELYVELITRVATQPLALTEGNEASALESVYSMFPTTREILRRKGREAVEFAKIAVVVLNQVVRPFTAKWHKLALAGKSEGQLDLKVFREELAALQQDLRRYAALLAEVAGVEDIRQHM